MRPVRLLFVGAAVGVAAAAIEKARHSTRVRAAWNVVRGYPTVYGIALLQPPPPPMLPFAPGQSHIFVGNSRFDHASTAITFPKAFA